MPENNPNTTLTYIVKLDRKLEIPEEIFKLAGSRGKNLVIVLPNTEDPKKILLFPTDAEAAIYTKIIIKTGMRLDDIFFIELRKTLAKYSLKPLFTTGICLEAEECYWSGVFDYKNNFEPEELRKDLLKIESVMDVIMKIMKPG